MTITFIRGFIDPPTEALSDFNQVPTNSICINYHPTREQQKAEEVGHKVTLFMCIGSV